MLLSTTQDKWWVLHDRLMPRTRGRSVVDVGAHDGGYTGIYLGHGARLVVAVEPGPNLHDRYLVPRFKHEPRVLILREALSDRAGTLHGVRHHHSWTLVQPGEYVGRLADQSLGGRQVEGEGTFDVPMRTLDELVDAHQLDDLSFVKIDVDGYEPKVLRGARRVMTSLRPPMLIELSYIPRDLGEDVRSFIDNIYADGYVMATLDGRVASADQVWTGWPWDTSFDMIMVPSEMLADLALARV